MSQSDWSHSQSHWSYSQSHWSYSQSHWSYSQSHWSVTITDRSVKLVLQSPTGAAGGPEEEITILGELTGFVSSVALTDAYSLTSSTWS